MKQSFHVPTPAPEMSSQPLQLIHDRIAEILDYQENTSFLELYREAQKLLRELPDHHENVFRIPDAYSLSDERLKELQDELIAKHFPLQKLMQAFSTLPESEVLRARFCDEVLFETIVKTYKEPRIIMPLQLGSHEIALLEKKGFLSSLFTNNQNITKKIKNAKMIEFLGIQFNQLSPSNLTELLSLTKNKTTSMHFKFPSLIDLSPEQISVCTQHLGHLKHVEFDLQCQYLKQISAIPHILSSLQNLRVLTLDYLHHLESPTRLQILSPHQAGQLRGLKISHSDLLMLHASDFEIFFGPMINLRYLSLRNSNLHNVSIHALQAIFGNLTHLEQLNLLENNLSQLSLSSLQTIFESLPNLRKLRVEKSDWKLLVEKYGTDFLPKTCQVYFSSFRE